MKIIGLRHIGIPIADPKARYEFLRALISVGFVTEDTGKEKINGNEIEWLKLNDGVGTTIEVLSGSSFHFAFEVDEVDKSAYYYMAPSGCKIQFDVVGGVPVEYVEPPKEDLWPEDTVAALESADKEPLRINKMPNPIEEEK